MLPTIRFTDLSSSASVAERQAFVNQASVYLGDHGINVRAHEQRSQPSNRHLSRWRVRRKTVVLGKDPKGFLKNRAAAFTLPLTRE